MYRPEGWENPYPLSVQSDEAGEVTVKVMLSDAEIYEAGADAMLEGLNSQEHQDWLATHDGENCKGKWVFIPEEKG